MRIAIIGMGGISRSYERALDACDGMRLVAVCDVDPSRTVEHRAQGVAVFDEARDLLDAGVADAVVVDTPPATHVELCGLALSRGVHVCCEKPLALSGGEAEALLGVADRNAAVLFTAFHRRYNRALPAAEELPLRDVRALRVRYLEDIAEHAQDLGSYLLPAAAGGGCIVDNGPNAFDAARHLVGDLRVEHAVATRSADGVDMAATIECSAASGVEVTIELDWAFPGEVKDARVDWSDGSETTYDMLAGFPGFKSSLDHEYVALLADFRRHVAEGRQDPYGAVAARWLEDALAATATEALVA